MGSAQSSYDSDDEDEFETAAPPPPAPPAAELSPTEQLLAAQAVLTRRAFEAQVQAAAQTNYELEQMNKARQRTQRIIVGLLMLLLLHWLRLRLRIRSKYEIYIDELARYRDIDLAKTGGKSDFGDPFRIALACEYPNMTQTLFSRTSNPHYPRAVIYALSTSETYAILLAQPNPAEKIFKLLEKANDDAALPAWEIVCSVFDEAQMCLEPCEPPDEYTAADGVTDTLYMGGTMAFIGDVFTPASVTGAVVGLAAGLVTGAIQASRKAAESKRKCEESQANCRADTRYPCD